MTDLFLYRILHVVGGMLWTGMAVFLALFLFPAFRLAGPASGPVMQGLIRRRLMVVLPLIALTTIATGFLLASRLGAGDFGAFARTASGRVYTMSGGLSVLAFLVGITVTRPAGIESGRIAAQLATMPDGPEQGVLLARLGVLQQRNNLGGRIIAFLVILTSIGMAVARYATS
jgi:uncharacterized membrane protein